MTGSDGCLGGDDLARLDPRVHQTNLRIQDHVVVPAHNGMVAIAVRAAIDTHSRVADNEFALGG
jgi:hypothetical protein